MVQNKISAREHIESTQSTPHLRQGQRNIIEHAVTPPNNTQSLPKSLLEGTAKVLRKAGNNAVGGGALVGGAFGLVAGIAAGAGLGAHSVMSDRPREEQGELEKLVEMSLLNSFLPIFTGIGGAGGAFFGGFAGAAATTLVVAVPCNLIADGLDDLAKKLG